MQYRKLDKLGIETSLLGFGCMRFPEKDGKIDREPSREMLKTAIENGVNYFDTAYVYHGGESETFTGEFLKDYPRDSFYMATKLPTWAVNSIADAERIFGEQLKRLEMEQIDFYLLHALDKNKWKKMKELGIPEYCDGLKKAGKIKYFGFSFHDDFECFKEIITAREWDFCQVQLNYMDTEEKQGGLGTYELCEKMNIPYIIMEPVKGGSLANLPDDIKSEFTDINPTASPASWAIRWCGSLPGVKIILSGMSKMEQVRDNLAVCADFKPLTEAEQAAVLRVKEKRSKRVYNGCTGCNYCMPCPAGVNIPWNFTIWNNYGIYENRGAANWDWSTMNDEQKPHNCTDCGACEEVCPQKLDVRGDLKKAEAKMKELKW